ncbi:hypothetical protein RJ639_021986 [Escallonia herrerae]|uniref:B box-type domain-containing protein n=1 Tax=Escallonia herrerae TaxID=1293975 RepID=A0AA88V2T1_9ASTE|nr:hypothetical protein RJ639_021986 [Escallonia herrerae]
MKARLCELCKGEATLHCASDSAFLCWECDATVHGANFLVARHVRSIVCFKCKAFTGSRFSGGGQRQLGSCTCRSCSLEPPDGDIDSLSSSSACVSSTTENSVTRPKKIDQTASSNTDVCSRYSKCAAKLSGEVRSGDSKVEGILVNWCTRLGLSGGGGGGVSLVAVQIASRAFGICLEKQAVLPHRVCLSASLWFGFKVVGMSTWQILNGLGEVSGVPAKLILGAQSKLERIMRRRRPLRHVQEEGWAECSA